MEDLRKNQKDSSLVKIFRFSLDKIRIDFVMSEPTFYEAEGRA